MKGPSIAEEPAPAVDLQDARFAVTGFHDGSIDGVVLRRLNCFSDRRGWLIELFRTDELPEGIFPQMAYLSQTEPGVARGPHEHREQTDCFFFCGPGDFRIFMWDARRESLTFNHRQVLTAGALNPLMIIVPPGVVHAYRNTGATPAWVFNAPDRLYGGPGHRQPVDEIRHENDRETPYLTEE